MTTLRNKKVLITGAARGMGCILADRFLQAGAEVLLVDCDGDTLIDTVTSLSTPDRVFPFVCDLSKRENIEQLRQDVLDRVGRIDVLVNNAGVVSGGTYTEIDTIRDETMLAVNIQAVHWMTKLFLPDLVSAPEGHIVQIASAAGFFGVPFQVVYCASKWFVIGLSEALRQELRNQGHSHVHLTTVCPSFVKTGMFAGTKAPLFTPFLTPEYVVDKIIKAVKKNRFYIKIPFMVKLSPILQNLLPARVVDLLTDIFGTNKAMLHFKGHA